MTEDDSTAIPGHTGTRRKVSSPIPTKLLEIVKGSLVDDKAREVVVIELAGKTSFADYMVIASGTSIRQMAAMAEHLRERLKTGGLKTVPIEGLGQCDWVLVDAGDVIVHLFRPEVRVFYNLEKMWGTSIPASGSAAGRLVS
jgi:ribosome-associated protein